jgi:hypothetical protein
MISQQVLIISLYFINLLDFVIIRVVKSIKLRRAGQERCIQNFGGEIEGKETTWKASAYMGG